MKNVRIVKSKVPHAILGAGDRIVGECPHCGLAVETDILTSYSKLFNRHYVIEERVYLDLAIVG